MNKLFEKIIDELKQESIIVDDDAGNRAVEIINQIAEEYNNGWIACRERLPEEHKLYDITFKNSTGIHSDSAIYNPYLKRWLWDADETELVENEVLAWAEKREPYRRKRCEDAKGDTEVD